MTFLVLLSIRWKALLAGLFICAHYVGNMFHIVEYMEEEFENQWMVNWYKERGCWSGMELFFGGLKIGVSVETAKERGGK